MSPVPSYADLLGKPYLYGGLEPAKGLDCLSTARIQLARIFPDFDPCELPCTEEEIEAVLSGSVDRPRWRLVGESIFQARLLGDLVHTRAVRDKRQGVLLLVNPPTRSFLSARPERGVCTIPERLIASIDVVLGVYRRMPR